MRRTQAKHNLNKFSNCKVHIWKYYIHFRTKLYFCCISLLCRQEIGPWMQWLIKIMLENEVERTSNLYHRIYYLHQYISLVRHVMKLELIVLLIWQANLSKVQDSYSHTILTLPIAMISYEINKMKNRQMIFSYVNKIHKNRNDPFRFVLKWTELFLAVLRIKVIIFVQYICMKNITWVKTIIYVALIVLRCAPLSNLMKTADNF